MKKTLTLSFLLICISAASLAESWRQAEENAAQSQQAIKFCNRFAHGWLSHADPKSGLLPQTVTGNLYWNAKDCAADNYPFIVLTAWVTEDYYLKRTVSHILDQEQKLTNRIDSLPDDLLFSTQSFRTEEPNLDQIIFGASEYAKDGLMPITEWIGPSPWLDRMEALIRDIWKHAAYETEVGVIPSTNVEVNGELLQTMSRLYWLTGDETFKNWCFRLADYYLLHQNIPQWESLRLDDHGCEIISGLSEAYLIASREDSERRENYKPSMHAILDCVLEKGVNKDGFVYNTVNARTGDVLHDELSDNWGYNYNAFLTVAEIDGEERYRDAVRHVLNNLHKYLDYKWEKGGADGYADSIEGAINLLNRVPVDSAFQWVDDSMQILFSKQRHDGIIEGWYGDGNSARTALMYALWKTQGIAPSPWREDLELGAVSDESGAVEILLKSDWPWNGRLRFDRKRHAEYFNMPMDYARINQFPEWFTVDRDVTYEVRRGDGAPEIIAGTELLDYPLTLKRGEVVGMTVSPRKESTMLRNYRYTTRSAEDAVKWQEDIREELFRILKLNHLRGQKIPLLPELISSEMHDEYMLREMEINSTSTRRIRVILTTPKQRPGWFPAVVCIHGHGGNRRSVYDPDSIYKGFAHELAGRGFVTIAADVGQHEVYEDGMIIMGERLWDLMRCVDYLESHPEVDNSRIGCAGLSLGGEMAMWLGAMDERIAAVVSSGFLTVMDQIEQNHCMCWKFDGLRELVDFADIYSLIAPRPLQCQNGLQEPPSQFPVEIARKALQEIKVIYADLGAEEKVALQAHDGGHEIDLPSLLAFFEKHFTTPRE